MTKSLLLVLLLLSLPSLYLGQGQGYLQYNWQQGCNGNTPRCNELYESWRDCRGLNPNQLCLCALADFPPGPTEFLHPGCNANGKCVLTSSVFGGSIRFWRSPLDAISSFEERPICVCNDAKWGAFCERSRSSDSSELSLTRWPYSLPRPPSDSVYGRDVFFTSQGASYATPWLLTGGRFASLEYGYHVDYGRGQPGFNYMTRLVNDGPYQTPIRELEYAITRMNRPLGGTQVDFATDGAIDAGILLLQGSGMNCPVGMISYGYRQGSLVCLCDPAQVKAGCSGRGRCRTVSPHQIATNSDSREFLDWLSGWKKNNPYGAIWASGTQQDPEQFSWRRFALWPRALDTDSLRSLVPMCMCDFDIYQGYFCELDVGRYLKCSGHGTWNNRDVNGEAFFDSGVQRGDCDCDNGWSGPDCSVYNKNWWFCGKGDSTPNGYGVYDPTRQTCYCTNSDTPRWGPSCDQSCSLTLCNGRGTCRPNDGPFNDGLTFVDMQFNAYKGLVDAPRVSNKCDCGGPDQDGLQWTGHHCEIKTRVGFECDGHGTITNVPQIDSSFSLPMQYCLPNSVNNVFNSITGRTVTLCPAVVETNGVAGPRCGGPTRGIEVIDQLTAVCSCQCHDGYTGEACQYDRCRRVNGNVCSGNGICLEEINRCLCNATYIGDDCQLFEIDGECSHNTQFVSN